ncbi:hypothetical protein PsorP6_015745 [Peronosclerospora sorghi]|uniref:Uncharacterized protein n=1 Tax=Peronosclerospora sorghi TaxID=230839 RepID=A0ACC0WN60_9STRA|nr:hypothetical protein PsorP6_015745 [Peronosclerospora sorghi]
MSTEDPVQRKTSVATPLSTLDDQARARGDSGVGDLVPVRERVLSLLNHHHSPVTTSMSVRKSTRRKRKVTFKNMYAPDVVPPSKVQSYDELVFTVAGLFHTTSFLHDPDDWGFEDPTSEGGGASDDEFDDPDPPLERSIPLMIAEFLYRSAIYLGYPPGETPWLPGFRQEKKFSSNDVKRWRRLAHFDWEAEERAFLNHHAPCEARRDRTESNGQTSLIATIGANFNLQRPDTPVHPASDDEATRRMQTSLVSIKKKVKLRRAVTNWIHRSRHTARPPRGADNVAMEAKSPFVERSAEPSDEKRKQTGRDTVAVSWLHPPPIASSRDLRLLVDIINSCVYCGQFRFRARDILRLCNVKI